MRIFLLILHTDGMAWGSRRLGRSGRNINAKPNDILKKVKQTIRVLMISPILLVFVASRGVQFSIFFGLIIFILFDLYQFKLENMNTQNNPATNRSL